MSKGLYAGNRKDDANPCYMFKYIALTVAVIVGYVLGTAGKAMWKDCIREDLHGS